MESGFRRERLRTHQHSSSNEILHVSVTEPRQGGGLVPRSGKRWVYSVTTSIEKAGVKSQPKTIERQSRDFSMLLATLIEHLPGIVLPRLPRESKRTMLQSGTRKEVLLTKRSITFDCFLNDLARHPIVKHDGIFRAFLTSPLKFSTVLESGQYATVRRDLLDLAAQHKSSSGWERWTSLDWFFEETLSVNMNFHTANEVELVENYTKIRFNLTTLANNMKALSMFKAMLKKMEKRQVVLSTWHQELSSLFNTLSLVERKACQDSTGFNRKQSSGERLTAFGSQHHESEMTEHFCGSEAIAGTFEGLSTRALEQADCYSEAKTRMKHEVLCKLSYEILCMEGLHNQLLFAKEKLQQWQDAHRKYLAIKRELEAFSAKQSKNEQRLQSLQFHLDAAETTVQNAATIASHWSRAVLFVESKQLRDARLFRSKRLCEDYSSIQMEAGKNICRIWSVQSRTQPQQEQVASAPFGIAVAEPVPEPESCAGIPTNEVANLRAQLEMKSRELDMLKRLHSQGFDKATRGIDCSR